VDAAKLLYNTCASTQIVHAPCRTPHAGGKAFSQKFGITILAIEIVMMICYGTMADYKVYSTTPGATGDVLQHYGKFQDVRGAASLTLNCKLVCA